MKKLSALLIPALLVFMANAQTYNFPHTGTTSISSCAGTLYDEGGTGVYSSLSSGVITLTPATPGGYVQLTFTSFLTESTHDILSIYDGNSTAGTLIGTYSGSGSPGTVVGTTVSGALTLSFVSDGSVSYDGFAATISCLTSIPNADLSILTPVLNNPVSAPTLTVGVNCYVRNNSPTTAISSSVGYYLSTDTLLDNGDVYLNYTNGGSIAGLTQAYRSATLTIPQGIVPGNYYILYVADYNNIILEDNESNNVAYKPILISAAVPDFVITSPALGASITYPTATVSASCNIFNQGVAGSVTSKVGFYLSADSAWDVTDTLLASSSGGTLSAGSSSNRNVSLTIPSGVAYGNYFILYVADYTFTENEALETNNVSVIKIAITPPRPDLAPYQPVLNQQLASQGSVISGSVQLKNLGAVNCPASDLGIYLSTDPGYSINDIFVTKLSANSLNSGATTNLSFSNVTIPNITPLGHYYVLFYADYFDVFNEITDSNNIISLQIDIVAPTIDLTIKSPSVSPAKVAAGGTLSASCTIYNTGTSNSPASNVGFYLSNDTVYDNSDILLNTATGGTLNYGSSSTRSSTLTIPANSSFGTKYIIFFADNQNQLNEFSEINNTVFTTVTVDTPYIDLRVSSPGFPSSIISGNTGAASCYVYNYGNITFTGAGKLGFFISANNTFDSTDILVDSVSFSNIVSNGNTSASKTITLPANLTPGNYYLIYYADFRNTISESNDSNNINAKIFTITTPTVDLQVYSASANPTTIAAGASVSTTVQLQNTGNSASSSGKVGFYLSKRTSYDSTALLIDSSAFNSISSSSNAYVYRTVTVPAGTAVGTYYLLYYADFRNQVTETNETNNVKYTTIYVVKPSPDLYVSTYSVNPSTVDAGSSTTISGYIYNDGNIATPPGKTGFYLSTDFQYSPSDIFLGEANFTAIAAGSSLYFSKSLTIPSATPGGYFYIIAYADYQDSIAENDENNNTNYENIYVTAPYIDLYVSSTSVNPTTVQGGSSVSATCYVHNDGNTDAPASSIGYYLSDNSYYDASDIFIDSATVGALTAGSDRYVSKTLTIPGNATQGYYYIVFYADYAGRIIESQENNNTYYDNLYISGPAPFPDLNIQNLTVIQSSVNAGSKVDFSFTANNSGGQSSGAFDVAVFLSRDSVYNSSDVLIDDVNVSALNSNSGYTYNESVTVPFVLSSGNYYLLVYSDFQNSVTEANENNNFTLKLLTVTGGVGINEIDGINSIVIGPNPAAERLHIQVQSVKQEEITSRIYNVQGQELTSQMQQIISGENEIHLEVGALPEALYLLNLSNKEGQTANYRFVVSHR